MVMCTCPCDNIITSVKTANRWRLKIDTNYIFQGAFSRKHGLNYRRATLKNINFIKKRCFRYLTRHISSLYNCQNNLTAALKLTAKLRQDNIDPLVCRPSKRARENSGGRYYGEKCSSLFFNHF